MSATYTAAVQAISADPELRSRVMAAGSAEERASLLRDAGVAVPTHADVNSHMASMADMAGVVGGKSSNSSGGGTVHTPTSTTEQTIDAISAVGASAGAAAA